MWAETHDQFSNSNPDSLECTTIGVRRYDMKGREWCTKVDPRRPVICICATLEHSGDFLLFDWKILVLNIKAGVMGHGGEALHVIGRLLYQRILVVLFCKSMLISGTRNGEMVTGRITKRG